MVVVCHACGTEFNELRGLNNHLRYCKAIPEWNARLKRQLQDTEQVEASSSSRDKRTRTTQTRSPPLDLRERSPTPEIGSESGARLGLSPGPSPPVSVSVFGRKRKVPVALRDYLPHSLAGLGAHLHPAPPKPNPLRVPSPTLSSTPEPPVDLEPELDTLITTEPNGFGVYRQYARAPQIDPEDDIMLDDLQNSLETPQASEPVAGGITGFYHPFPNATIFQLLHWFYQRSATKSKADLTSIVRDVIQAEDFNQDDIKDFNADREIARLDEYSKTNSPFLAHDGWREGTVKLQVPNAKSKYMPRSLRSVGFTSVHCLKLSRLHSKALWRKNITGFLSNSFIRLTMGMYVYTVTFTTLMPCLTKMQNSDLYHKILVILRWPLRPFLFGQIQPILLISVRPLSGQFTSSLATFQSIHVASPVRLLPTI